MAEGTKRIEQLAPELDRIIEISQSIQELADGFGGPQGPAEGPVWWQEGGYLVFSDIHNNRRMKYEPGRGASVLLEPTNRANGLTRDPQGRLVACEHDSRRVTRQEHDGSITVIANSFQGRQIRRLHLFHRPLGPSRRGAAMGSDLCRRLPRDPGFGPNDLVDR
jgi:gluconolactonase